MSIKNGDLPAMPLANGADGTPWKARDLGNPEQVVGLTKREIFAMAAMQGYCADGGLDYCYKTIAESAVGVADALLAELERTK